MISLIEQFLKSLSAEAITETFFWLLLGIAIVGLGCFLFSRAKKRERLAHFADYAPILLTSVGILGTFTGIVAGLLNFDIDHIDSSISTLLGGMKTAFLTSVIGVSLSIGLKIAYTVLSRSKKAGNQGMNINQLVEHFYEQGEQNKQQTQHLHTLSRLIEQQTLSQAELPQDIASIAKALGSEAESSLLGQLKLLRSDLNDALRLSQKSAEQAVENLQKITTQFSEQRQHFEAFTQNLWRELQHFADLLSKSATEAVINALKQVIVEFNQNLTEQFGENFKELNQAVLKLVEWQENYKQQLNEMISLYSAGVQSLEATEKSVSDIEQKTQAIPATMMQLGEVIEINQHQITHLNAHLDAFAELRDKAVAAVPETQKQVDLMLDNVATANTQMAKALETSGKQLQETLAHSVKQVGSEFSQFSANLAKEITACTTQFSQDTQQANTQLNASSQALVQTAQSIATHQKALSSQQQQTTDQLLQFTQKWQSEFEQHSRRVQDAFAKSVEEMARKHSAEAERLMSHLESESKKALASTGESVNKQLELIDKSMQAEVQRVMQEMGRALATISGKFTDDYKKLVEAMGNITRSRF